MLIRTIMDVLSDILKKIKLSSAIYFESDFSSPWGMTIPKGRFAQFHIVTKGQCLMKTEDRKIQLLEGDIIVFPFGTSHSLADFESGVYKNGQEVVAGIMDGKPVFVGDRISTRLVCGHFQFDRNMEHPFIQELPAVIHISGIEKNEFAWLESITDLIIQEAGNDNPGKDTIMNKLGEVLFVHVLRTYLQKNSKKKGFIAAMQDKRIGRVLKSIHRSPEKDWQLPTLAKVAGMSRTSFSNHFKRLTGETPFRYITQWRMLQAKELLLESNIPVGEIAERVGYQSEAAFNRVFKKNAKRTPLKFRQHS